MNVGTSNTDATNGQPSHDLVLVDGDLGPVVIAHAGEQVAREVQAVGRARQFVVGVGESKLDVAREQRDLAVELDAIVEHCTRGVARRREHAAHVEDRSAPAAVSPRTTTSTTRPDIGCDRRQRPASRCRG